VFCPTEKAFIKAGRKLGVKGKKDELNAKLVTLATANSQLFTSILAGHAVVGAVNSTAAASLIGKPAVPTLLLGFGLTFTGKPDKLQIEFPVASLKKNGGGPSEPFLGGWRGASSPGRGERPGGQPAAGRWRLHARSSWRAARRPCPVQWPARAHSRAPPARPLAPPAPSPPATGKTKIITPDLALSNIM
jgi:hypothetical protein